MTCIYFILLYIVWHVTMRYRGGKVSFITFLCIDNTKTTTPTNGAYIICWWDKIMSTTLACLTHSLLEILPKNAF